MSSSEVAVKFSEQNFCLGEPGNEAAEWTFVCCACVLRVREPKASIFSLYVEVRIRLLLLSGLIACLVKLIMF